MFTSRNYDSQHSNYLVHCGALTIYHNNNRWGGTLNVLTDPTESKHTQKTNHFISLSFSYYDHYTSNPIIFSLAKSAQNILLFRLNYITHLNLCFHEEAEFMQHFSQSIEEIFNHMIEASQYLSEQSYCFINTSLLKNLMLLLKEISSIETVLDPATQVKLAKEFLSKIDNLFKTHDQSLLKVIDSHKKLDLNQSTEKLWSYRI